MSTKTGIKMNAQSILGEMYRVLARSRAGLMSSDEARQELAILRDMHRVYETAILDERISSLEAVLEGRKNGR